MIYIRSLTSPLIQQLIPVPAISYFSVTKRVHIISHSSILQEQGRVQYRKTVIEKLNAVNGAPLNGNVGTGCFTNIASTLSSDQKHILGYISF